MDRMAQTAFAEMDAQPFAAAGLQSSYGWITRCTHVVVAAGVPDVIGEEPQTAAALAAKTGCNADALERMLRLLSAAGTFERLPDGRYANNAVSRCYMSGPRTARATTLMAGTALIQGALAHLDHTLQTGEASITQFAPEGQWGYYQAHPEEARVFNDAMSDISRGAGAAVVAAYDFSTFRSIADVGGGQGEFLKAILEAAPQARGVLFDVAEVVAGAPARERMAVMAGSFFQAAPEGCDAYLLKNILHDWPDAKARDILMTVREHARRGTRLLVVESLRHEGPGFDMSLIIDVMMLAIHGARERTADEFKRLFEGTGWRFDRVIQTPSPLVAIVEATGV
jgi:nucleotide-binding universal stress UspA family protein